MSIETAEAWIRFIEAHQGAALREPPGHHVGGPVGDGARRGVAGATMSLATRNLAAVDRMIALDHATKLAGSLDAGRDLLFGRDRCYPAARARRDLYATLRAAGWSYLRIARAVGRNHATIHYAINGRRRKEGRTLDGSAHKVESGSR